MEIKTNEMVNLIEELKKHRDSKEIIEQKLKNLIDCDFVEQELQIKNISKETGITQGTLLKQLEKYKEEKISDVYSVKSGKEWAIRLHVTTGFGSSRRLSNPEKRNKAEDIYNDLYREFRRSLDKSA